MAGFIVKRGERKWLVRIPLGRDSRGKRLFHSRTVTGSKKDAQRYLTLKQRELDTGTFVQETQQTLEVLLRQWLQTAKARVRERTISDYESLATHYLLPPLGHRKISNITPGEIQAVYADMLQRGLSARTVRYAHSVLHGALDQAVRWQRLSRNVAKLVDLPRQERREMRALTPDEATRLLTTAQGTRYYALWAVLLTSGLRPGEALALKWADLDGDRVRVQRALVRSTGNRWQLAEPKTPRARRVVSLPASTLRALQAHRAKQLEERLKAGAEWADHDLIFATRSGEPLDYRVIVRRHFKRLLKSAALPPMRPYDLRHSCATLLLAAGENVKVVSERLGHASAALTLDIYSHVLPDMQQRAAERLEGLLFMPESMRSVV